MLGFILGSFLSVVVLRFVRSPPRTAAYIINHLSFASFSLTSHWNHSKTSSAILVGQVHDSCCTEMDTLCDSPGLILSPRLSRARLLYRGLWSGNFSLE